MVPAKANENKHVFHYVTPLWIIINILFPILCNFGIIQIYALAWVGGFASGNWHYTSKAQKEENMSIIFTHFQTEGDNRTSSSIVCPPSSCRVSFEVRGCWRIDLNMETRWSHSTLPLPHAETTCKLLQGLHIILRRKSECLSLLGVPKCSGFLTSPFIPRKF